MQRSDLRSLFEQPCAKGAAAAAKGKGRGARKKGSGSGGRRGRSEQVAAEPQAEDDVEALGPAGRPAPELLRWARARGSARTSGGKHAREVVPGVLVGNRQAASDRELLDRLGVKAIVCVGSKPFFSDDLVYHHIGIKDDGEASMQHHFLPAAAFIARHRSQGVVLVHCQGGISRSPAVILGYLMIEEGLRLQEAAEVLFLAHPGAKPRQVFLDDLARLSAELSEVGEEDAAHEEVEGDQLPDPAVRAGPAEPAAAGQAASSANA